MFKSRSVLVKGRVQGVYYRASTQRTARELGLTGWVKNLPNGDVEAVICGEVIHLDQLQAWMQSGPTGARVDALQTCEIEMLRYDDFYIHR